MYSKQAPQAIEINEKYEYTRERYYYLNGMTITWEWARK
jgi:hypothetical protein